MSFPATVGTHVSGSQVPFRHLGPFQDNSGNLWVFGFAGTSATVITAYKSTDGGNTWGTTFNSGGTLGLGTLDVYFDTANQIFYAVVTTTGNVLQVYKFTISTTTWARFDTTTGPTVVSAQSGSGTATMCPGLSSGAFVVHYQTSHLNMSVTWHETHYVTLSSAGVWGTAVLVPPSNNTTDYSCVGCVQGASNRVHLFYTQSTASPFQIIHRSVSSAAVLDTAAAIASGFICSSGNNVIGMGAPYYDGTNVWVGPSYYGTSQGQMYSAASGANPTWTAEAIGTGSTDTTENGTVYYDGTTEWAFFTGVVSGAGNTCYYESRTGTSGSWGTKTTAYSVNNMVEANSGGLLFLPGGSTVSSYAPFPSGATAYTDSATVSGVTTISGGEIRTTTIYKAGIIAQAPIGISPPPQISIRAKRGGSDSGSLLVSLYDGTVLVDSWTITLTNGFNTYTHQIANASLISDWSQLQLWVQGSSDPGSTLTATVSWVRLTSLPQIQQMGTNASKPLLVKLAEKINHFHLLNGPIPPDQIKQGTAYTESATVGGVTSVQSTETTDFLDTAGTVQGTSSVVTTEVAAFVEDVTVAGVTTVTSIELYIPFTPPGTVRPLMIKLERGKLKLLGMNILNPDDSVRVSYVDSATVGGVTSVQASESANFVDTGGTIQGTSSVSSSESTDYADSNTVGGTTSPSAADIAASVDATTVSGVTSLSAVEVAAYVDSDTPSGVTSLSATETTDYVESATITSVTSLTYQEQIIPQAAIPRPLMIKLQRGRFKLLHNNLLIPDQQIAASYVDSATVSSVTSVQSTESTDFVDSGGTVQGTSSITTTEIAGFVDSTTISGSTTLSSTDVVVDVDANTVSGVTSPSATDIAAYVDANTISGSTSPSAVEASDYIDANTCASVTGVSVVEAAGYVDADTCAGVTSLNTVETADYVDAQTASGVTTPSATEIAAYVDADTPTSVTTLIYLEIAVSPRAPYIQPLLIKLVRYRKMHLLTNHEVGKTTPALINTDSATIGGITSISSVDTADFVDSQTISGKTTPTTTDVEASIDANTANGVTSVSYTEQSQEIDANTIQSKTDPSGSTDIYLAVDSTTVTGTTTVITTTEGRDTTDSSTIPGITSPSSTDVVIYLDLATATSTSSVTSTEVSNFVDSSVSTTVTSLTSQEQYGRSDSSVVESDTTPTSADTVQYVDSDSADSVTTVIYVEQYIPNPTQQDAATVVSTTTIGAAEVEFIVELVGYAAKHFIVLGVAEHYSASSTMHFATGHDKHYQAQAVNDYATHQ